jgi:glycine/D-amino acid oxidase-like deaminating enzyme
MPPAIARVLPISEVRRVFHGRRHQRRPSFCIIIQMAFNNRSPWIHQLNKERQIKKLDQDIETDIAIVGAGIAGIATAFYLLKYTDKNIVVIEAHKLAHGATGHNAGYMATYFERPFRSMVEEFGLEMACQAQMDVDSAWELTEEIYTDAGLDISLARFHSYAGLSTKEQLLGHLENDLLRRKGGLRTYPVEIWEQVDFLSEIPKEYHKLFTLVSREEIALKLETFDPQYIAVLSSQKGVMNSALFCQEVAEYLFEKYAGRFFLYEHTKVNKVIIKDENTVLDCIKHTVIARQTVLCTNGFENFDIISPSGLSVNTRFHHNINGVVAFMSGYLEPYTGIPAAISYFQKKGDKELTDNPGEGYFYVSRRSYEYERDQKHNLISVGGPDYALEDRAKYDRNQEFSSKAKDAIDRFVKDTYDKKYLNYAFMWHGIMGYTKNLLRMVGKDPDYPRLLYNLGCNGLGLLPSIFGGNKVARIINGENFPTSVFDIPKRVD